MAESQTAHLACLHPSNQTEAQDAELRLQRQIGLWQKAEAEHKLANQQLQYLKRINQTLSQEHKILKNGLLLGKKQSTSTWKRLIGQLTHEVTRTDAPYEPEKAHQNSKKLMAKEGKKQGQYLREVLDHKQRAQEEQEIAQLQSKLQRLYQRVGHKLEEELMSDRILSRIKKQATRSARQATLTAIRQQVKKYQQWQGLANEKAVAVATEKQVEQKIVQNLELMKLLMSTKVENNDFAFEQLGDQTNYLSQKIKNIPSQSVKIRDKVKEGLSAFERRRIEESSQVHTTNQMVKEVKLHMQSIDEFLEVVERSVWEGQKWGEQRELQVEQGCSKISASLERLYKR